MIVPFSRLSELPAHDICVVGGGPVGLATALACEDAGLSVLLLESGEGAPEPFAAALGSGHKVDPKRHAEPAVAMCRALGGTSTWWGGRCVPFDDIDFADRPFVPDAAWPLSHADVSRHYAAAADFFGIGPARFESRPGTAELDEVLFDRLERWAPEINMAVRHRARLEASRRVTVVLGASVTDLALDPAGRRVTQLAVSGRTGSVALSPQRTVLACGGLETARLLLVAQRRHPAAFGGVGGPLGRTYMGHASGKIADVVLSDPASVADHDFFLDDGVFVRRRFNLKAEVQLREGVLNTSFWADNPPFRLAEHGNGVLSLAWCALAFPPVGRRLASEGVRITHVGPAPLPWRRHIWNIVRSPFATLAGIAGILNARFLSRPRRPGFLVRNRGGRYSLHYHAEHAPNPRSRVTLSDRLDPLGMPYLDVDLQFTPVDALSVVRSHEILDAALQRGGVGRLAYRKDGREARVAAVFDQAADGFHQAGTVRMADTAERGVVDGDCRVHGIDNLWLAGCGVLPSSGQANPTFVAAALGLRLAGHLAASRAPAPQFLEGAAS